MKQNFCQAHTEATKKMRFEHTNVFVQCDTKTRLPLIER